MTTTRRHRRVLALVAAWFVVGALAGAGCGGDDDSEDSGAGPTESGSTTTSSPPTTLSPEEEAEAVYLEFVDVIDRLVTEAPNPDDEDLTRLAVDPVLGTVRDSVATLEAENQLWQQGDRSSHEVYDTALDGIGNAVIRACVVENDLLIDADDGSVVREPPLMTRDLTITVQRTELGWAVAEIETTRAMDGEVACV